MCLQVVRTHKLYQILLDEVVQKEQAVEDQLDRLFGVTPDLDEPTVSLDTFVKQLRTILSSVPEQQVCRKQRVVLIGVACSIVYRCSRIRR